MYFPYLMRVFCSSHILFKLFIDLMLMSPEKRHEVLGEEKEKADISRLDGGEDVKVTLKQTTWEMRRQLVGFVYRDCCCVFSAGEPQGGSSEAAQPPPRRD